MPARRRHLEGALGVRLPLHFREVDVVLSALGEHVRTIDADAGLRMRADALDGAIRADLARRRLPMAVIATAGTVNTGAIDPLDEIADVCAAHGVWLHVDGAYGAPAVLSTKYRDRPLGLARADRRRGRDAGSDVAMGKQRPNDPA